MTRLDLILPAAAGDAVFRLAVPVAGPIRIPINP